jgi:hypothetical protein
MEHAEDEAAVAGPVEVKAVTPHPAALESEIRLIDEAIAMVALGAAPRVDVAGIRFAADLLDQARRHALEAGVRVRPILSDGEASGISVERIRG